MKKNKSTLFGWLALLVSIILFSTVNRWQRSMPRPSLFLCHGLPAFLTALF